MEDERDYHPMWGEELPGSTLRVPTSHVEPGGERCSGSTYVGPGHPRYEEWLSIIRNKQQHQVEYREGLKRAREERRRFYRLVLDEDE